MADDGNRQVAVTLDQVAISLGLNQEQFDALLDLGAQQDQDMIAISGAILELTKTVAAPDTSVAQEIASLKEAVSVGFSDVRQSITDLNNVIFDRSVDLAKWLAAIALAAANPADNTAVIQKLIDEQAAKLDSDATAMNDALNQINQKKES